MTPQEFESYLKSIGGLINGYFPDREPITSRYYCSVNDGWLQLLHDLIEELIATGWDKHILQIKEKYGGLRFYTLALTDEQYKIVEKYEDLSYLTCEVCGKPGETRGGGWIVTLCDEHANKKGLL
jgi:hypothetical protein